MTIKHCAFIMVLMVLMSPAMGETTAPSGAIPACDLDVVMQQRRAQAAQRHTDINREGIQRPNASVLENLPNVRTGACLDQVYQVIGAISDQVGGTLGTIFKRVAGDRLARMGCDRARKYYEEILNAEIGRFGDELGIIRYGRIGDYREDRTTRVKVRDAIELGRRASEAMSNAPQGPIGRTAPATPSIAPANREGLNNAIQGL